MPAPTLIKEQAKKKPESRPDKSHTTVPAVNVLTDQQPIDQEAKDMAVVLDESLKVEEKLFEKTRASVFEYCKHIDATCQRMKPGDYSTPEGIEAANAAYQRWVKKHKDNPWEYFLLNSRGGKSYISKCLKIARFKPMCDPENQMYLPTSVETLYLLALKYNENPKRFIEEMDADKINPAMTREDAKMLTTKLHEQIFAEWEARLRNKREKQDAEREAAPKAETEEEVAVRKMSEDETRDAETAELSKAFHTPVSGTFLNADEDTCVYVALPQDEEDNPAVQKAVAFLIAAAVHIDGYVWQIALVKVA